MLNLVFVHQQRHELGMWRLYHLDSAFGSLGIAAQLSNQRQIIVAGFGFNSLQTTLIGCVDGVVESTFRPSLLLLSH